MRHKVYQGTDNILKHNHSKRRKFYEKFQSYCIAYVHTYIHTIENIYLFVVYAETSMRKGEMCVSIVRTCAHIYVRETKLKFLKNCVRI